MAALHLRATTQTRSHRGLAPAATSNLARPFKATSKRVASISFLARTRSFDALWDALDASRCRCLQPMLGVLWCSVAGCCHDVISARLSY
ncbi:hypothetical protein BR93DRAFT_931463 [Coniochaeta sp. PMI_546]|nr:hypothetical protein BR93DRAFT_931463 [Coniochaeta sp. PMI_546]